VGDGNASAIAEASVQFGIFGVGLFQNGNVGIGVLPQGEKVLIGEAAFRLIAGKSPFTICA